MSNYLSPCELVQLVEEGSMTVEEAIEYADLVRFFDEQAFPGKLGTGERFEACVKEVMGRPGFTPKVAGQSKREAAEAICAAIGREKYGKAQFQKLAVAGK